MSNIDEKLGLYQIFLKLYEQNRELLDEILNLEIASDSGLATWSGNHVIGVIEHPHVYLITNLGFGKMKKCFQPETVWTIGRGTDLMLSIPDEHLSRNHAAIQYIPNQGFYLYDLNSTNGTFVNHEWVKDSVLLKDGDQIRLGSIVFSFFICFEQELLPPIKPEVARFLQPEFEGVKRDRAEKGKIIPEKTSPLFDSLDAMGWDDYLPPTSPDAFHSLTEEQQAELLERFYQDQELRKDTPSEDV